MAWHVIGQLLALWSAEPAVPRDPKVVEEAWGLCEVLFAGGKAEAMKTAVEQGVNRLLDIGLSVHPFSATLCGIAGRILPHIHTGSGIGSADRLAKAVEAVTAAHGHAATVVDVKGGGSDATAAADFAAADTAVNALGNALLELSAAMLPSDSGAEAQGEKIQKLGLAALRGLLSRQPSTAQQRSLEAALQTLGIGAWYEMH